VHVTGSYYPAVIYGGPIFSIHNLCKYLVREGIDVTVLTTNANGVTNLDYPAGKQVNHDGVQVYYYPRSIPTRHIVSLALRTAIRGLTKGYELIHAHSSFCFHTLWAAKKAETERVPFVISPRGSLNERYIEKKSPLKKKVWFRLIERHILENADVVHFTSDHEKSKAQDLDVKIRRSEVIPNGVDPEEWNNNVYGEGFGDINASLDQPFVLYLGRLSWEKGIRQLIEAMGIIQDEFPQLQLILAGSDNEGFMPQIQKWSLDSGIIDRVRYVGFLDRSKQKLLLEKCSFLVLPSTSESFGMVAAEALYFSKPVVLTPGVGIAEEVERAGAGIIVEQANKGIADGMRFLLQDTECSREMGMRGRLFVEKNYVWPSIAKKMIKVYEDILALQGL